MPIRNLVTLFLVTAICIACAIQARTLRYGGKVGQAIGYIEDFYVNEVDPQNLYIAAMEGVVSKLDQFSNFIPPQYYHEFQSTIEQHFGGIGINIEGPPNVKRLTVIAPIPNTPAFRAGMQSGDMILEIDGQSTEGLTSSDATKLMRGPVGTTVRLLVKRMDGPETLTLEIPRADIEIRSIEGDQINADSTWNYRLKEDPRIAYVRIGMFGERTLDEFRAVLEQIRGQAQALVIDLRSNPGGVLPVSVKMCDMLVDEGVILRTKGRNPIFDSEFPASPQLLLDRHIPIVVLVNGESASASEIMAGCLQDLGRAKIAGSRSYGKGTVQQVFELESDTSALKFTTARFIRPSGRNIHRTEKMTDADEWGVSPEPELNVPLTDIQQIYLDRRWQISTDPRTASRGDRPPEPPFAGDPQLQAAVGYLWKEIGSADTAPEDPQATNSSLGESEGAVNEPVDNPRESELLESAR